MPGAKNNWWRRIAKKATTWLTPINTVVFGISFIGAIVKVLLTWNKANNPAWYGITHEHAEEIKPCLTEYMPEASWGEALSTFFTDDWWSWEIVGWACAVGLPVLIMVIAFEKYNAYQRVRDMLFQRKLEKTMIQLDSVSEKNLIYRLSTIPLTINAQVSEYREAIKELLAKINDIDINTITYNIKYYLRQLKTFIESNNNQIPNEIGNAIEEWLENEENNTFPVPDEIQSTISAKTVWRNSYKEILLIITPKIGLNFSFLLIALYELTVGNHYAKKYVRIVPDILDQLKHNPNYRHFNKDCLDVISRALATNKVYNINTKLISLLVPAIIITGIGVYVVLPKFTKWIRGSDNEEEMRLIEGTETTYGTQQEPIELTNILPQHQVLI
ncbi:MAG: hypothetical protein AMJ43_05225 [Coxiella sp. DG_40]|nr:MAG: hypothetical protein AMJ43_05225 [Coxiella sp. DG_40]